MSLSVKDSLTFNSVVKETSSPGQVLYLRNKTATQTTVEIQSTSITNRDYSDPTVSDYRLESATIVPGVSAVCRLGATRIGTAAVLTTTPISRLVYDYLSNAYTTANPDIRFPTYDQLTITVGTGVIAYQLQADPLLVDTEKLVYPVFLQVPTAAALAIQRDASGVTPPSELYESMPYIDGRVYDEAESIQSLIVTKDTWTRHFIQTPDQQWWFVTTTGEHTDPRVLKGQSLSLLFNPDGHKENNPYYATVMSRVLELRPAAWDECAGATVDLAFKLNTETNVTVTVDNVPYQFNSIADLYANARQVLPSDIDIEFLSQTP